MKIFRLIITLVILLSGTLKASASEIIVTVSPKQSIMPPQILMYLDDPGRFFTITLTNTTNDVQNVYLGLNLKQITPANSDINLSTPSNRQPALPFSVKANTSYQLSTIEMKNYLTIYRQAKYSALQDYSITIRMVHSDFCLKACTRQRS